MRNKKYFMQRMWFFSIVLYMSVCMGSGLPDIDWFHIQQPSLSKKWRVRGYHWRGLSYLVQPEIYNKTSNDFFGCYRATFIFHDQQKTSTFFPDGWHKSDIERAIYQAYNDQISPQMCSEDGSCGFVGITANGMRVQIWLAKNRYNQTEIVSAYPVMSGSIS